MIKAQSIFSRSMRQQARDRFGLALTLLTAPFFVLFYWAVFPDGPAQIAACIDGDEALVASVEDALEGSASTMAVDRCEPGSEVAYDVVAVIEGEVDAAALRERPLEVTFRGDASRPAFARGAQELEQVLGAWVASETGRPPLVATTVEPAGASRKMSPFDLYVPNLLIFAVIMLVFSSAMSLAREIERGTLERLRLTRMRTRDYLAGMAATQVVLGAGSVVLTFGVALALGFEAAGSVALAGAIAVGTGVACVGIGTLVASFSRSVAQAFVIASFFMFLLVLFSGIVFPVPGSAAFDLLPTVHGARAMHEVLVLGRGAGEVWPGLAALGAQAALIFGAAGLRFRRLHRSFLLRDPS